MSLPISLSKTTKIPTGNETKSRPKITDSSATNGIAISWTGLLEFCNLI